MHTFIRVIEIWTPSESGEYLEYNNGYYGPLEDFKSSSMQEKFVFGEGLPGSAWQQARPVVLKEFDDKTFLRTQSAHEVGLTSGIAIPVFSSETLKAVIVFLCGDSNELSGAIEVWSDDGLSGLALIDGYYGDLERFEVWIPDGESLQFKAGILQDSEHVETAQPGRRIQKGRGVIGETLLSGIPVLSSELTADSLPEITHGNVNDYTSLLAIPIYFQNNMSSVVAFYN